MWYNRNMETDTKIKKNKEITPVVIEKKEPIPTREKKPEERVTGKENPYAYTIKDVAFGEFKVLNTANAWWIDRAKVQRLIDAYKIDANNEEACAYSGITITQLKYFQTLHQEFYTIKDACRQLLGLQAKQALATKVKSGVSAEWYLERRRKDEYSLRVENTGADGRDLFEQLSEKYNKLNKELLNDNNGQTTNNNEEHPSDSEARNDNAKQGGDGNDATTPDSPREEIKTTT